MIRSEAYIPVNLFESGSGHVVVTRRKGAARIEAGVFLLDAWCLGIKDAFFFCGSQEDLDELLNKIKEHHELEQKPAATGRKLVEEAVRYAQRLGFSPHRDYKKAARVFGGVASEECSETFTFGKDGKPFFISDPNISPHKTRAILRQLEASCGKGNFDYLLELDELEMPDPDLDTPGENYELEDEFPLLMLSDSASNSETPLDDAIEWANQALSSFENPISSSNVILADQQDFNISARLLDLASSFLPEAKIALAENPESPNEDTTLSLTLSLLFTSLALINIPDEMLTEANMEHIVEFKENILKNVPKDDLPPFIVLDYHLTPASQSTTGKPRLICLFQPTLREVK